MRNGVYTLFILVASTIASCTGNKVYDVYDPTPIAGWEKNDTLVFEVPRMRETANYSSDLGLRITGEYPFMELTLIVEQTVYPRKRVVTDTINCHLVDGNGHVNGQGLSYYQYNFHITDLFLHQGDSVHVCVRHNMKREILPGVSDIGMQLSAY